jgi:hypothetical protein
MWLEDHFGNGSMLQRNQRESSAAHADRGSRPARVAKFPVNCVNYFTLEGRKIWEPYFAKLNVTQKGMQMRIGSVSPSWSRLA